MERSRRRGATLFTGMPWTLIIPATLSRAHPTPSKASIQALWDGSALRLACHACPPACLLAFLLVPARGASLAPASPGSAGRQAAGSNSPGGRLLQESLWGCWA